MAESSAEIGELAKFDTNCLQTQIALREIRDELNLCGRGDVRMSAEVDEELIQSDEEQESMDAKMLNICPSLKANLLFAAPQSEQLAPVFFSKA